MLARKRYVKVELLSGTHHRVVPAGRYLLTRFGKVSSNVGMKQTLLKWPTVRVRQVTPLRGHTVLNLARCRRGWPAINDFSWSLSFIDASVVSFV